ncbi:orotidine-5'-phosphate decarboxylase [Tumebacillus sp. ITR2]|uniref:Orotidine 5'-phosphate decarboxylase n=1 Tax=Tumebacillus amylolyticus TaxID=2801339 RepID=A0ABS1JET4_9BACL|nr:orotidine-5'-phosphate decarboxylase [Tumebacillus amylolyticus]MBL0388767.1 orotidine-5'-phosphate decarboxylase [Tumebacillus amylolyticus]
MTTQSPAEKIFVALDYDNMDDALRLADRLGDTIRTMKVGLQLFFKSGPVILDRLHDMGFQVFMDCKFHDIPNTVAGASDSVTSHGVYMFNVHVGGGVEMMRRAKQAAITRAESLGIAVPKVIGVTQLTSTTQSVMNDEIGILGDVGESVISYARLAQQAGLDGVVASGHEIQGIREACGSDFLTVIPGIRPTWAEANDQARIMTPTEALRAGASYLVIGRAITHADDPRAAALRILEEVQASEGAIS